MLAILFIGYVRFQLIKHETYKGILNEDVDFVYHHKDKPHDKQEFMRDIYQLAVWKNEKLEEIDHLFIISDSYTSMYPYYSKPNGFRIGMPSFNTVRTHFGKSCIIHFRILFIALLPGSLMVVIHGMVIPLRV